MGKRAKRERRHAERQATAAAAVAESRAAARAEIIALRCPSCGGDAISRLFYGLPRFDPEMNADLDAHLIVLAGTDFAEDDPKWLCRGCKHVWGRLLPDRSPSAGPVASSAQKPLTP